MKNEFNTAIDYEASFRYLIEKSNKRAWLIAFISIFIAIISIIAVVLLTPLKTIEPYVIRVDNTTGMVDILTMLDEKEIKANEALDKYFISTYVKAREGYY
ncbi:type IV secretion system protein, partial [Campylobacter jejuni]|nr:type IV secretion system protein [Campylobacter jejuni]